MISGEEAQGLQLVDASPSDLSTGSRRPEGSLP